MDHERLKELTAMIRDNHDGEPHFADVLELCDLQQGKIAELEAEVARYHDALQTVSDMHNSDYENLPRHVIDVQSIIDRSMTPEVDAEDTTKYLTR